MEEINCQHEIVQQVISAVSSGANISASQSLLCVQVTLQSLQEMTNRYGSIDLSIFGLAGVYTRKQLLNANLQ